MQLPAGGWLLSASRYNIFLFVYLCLRKKLEWVFCLPIWVALEESARRRSESAIWLATGTGTGRLPGVRVRVQLLLRYTNTSTDTDTRICAHCRYINKRHKRLTAAAVAAAAAAAAAKACEKAAQSIETKTNVTSSSPNMYLHLCLWVRPEKIANERAQTYQESRRRVQAELNERRRESSAEPKRQRIRQRTRQRPASAAQNHSWMRARTFRTSPRAADNQ